MNALSPLTLVAHATAVFPNFNVVGLTEISSNDGVSIRQGVVDANGDRWEIVAPLNEAEGAKLEAETTLLRFLKRAHEKGFIPFSVAVPVAHSRVNETLPLFIYAEAPGTPLEFDDLYNYPTLSHSIGNTLAALHRLPAEIMERTGLPIHSAADCRELLRAQLIEASRAWPLPANLYRRWETALDDDTLFNFTPTPIHGNVDIDSFLAVKGAVTTMRDFSAACLGDPAEDLANLLAGEDEDLIDRFLAAYLKARKDHVDLHLVTRGYLYAEFNLLRWLLQGIRNHDSEVIADAKTLIQTLADRIGNEPLLPEHAEVERNEVSLLEVAAAVTASQNQADTAFLDPAKSEAETVVLTPLVVQEEWSAPETEADSSR
ncbi:phosphotransferase [Gleimia sp. 6138-11-ORH1]|uniref:phosphotransferase n=1 Tax=Gleimia sp. 6138-11-ORH1 TaxID=2973937 RepID=UPI0021675A14|nr:phosphotransferase [Gleimia sp. 6138-11-ORH1]MCS4483981.1 phosphotransferase [Gleimia sp. 6138-11-ORH1]